MGMLSADAPNEEWCIVTSTLFQLDWKSLFPHQGLKAMHWMLSADAPNEEWCIVTSGGVTSAWLSVFNYKAPPLMLVKNHGGIEAAQQLPGNDAPPGLHNRLSLH